ncbi:hypothetical protein LTR09_012808 [Extremus antarcticus]|uniref:Uncharacterized protein n=1 Tax=Extremus antarcticus TaxID=702011 RepID=A0AAJ0D9F3_9PEZI|nr:hypothetical protein LTR09_012808 [Extremus antarcticus]
MDEPRATTTAALEKITTSLPPTKSGDISTFHDYLEQRLPRSEDVSRTTSQFYSTAFDGCLDELLRSKGIAVSYDKQDRELTYEKSSAY